MLTIRNPQDFWAAVLFVVAGMAGLWFGQDYTIGVASRMGPGYFPMVLSCALLAVGAVLGARSLATDGPALEGARWRPLLLVVISVVAFSFLLNKVGLVVTAAAVAVLASLASPERIRWIEVIALSCGMSAFATVLFVVVLQQPIPIWWWP